MGGDGQLGFHRGRQGQQELVGPARLNPDRAGARAVGEVQAPGLLDQPGRRGHVVELTFGQEIGILIAGFVGQEAGVAHGEVAPGGLEFGVAAAQNQPSAFVPDADQVLAVLMPAVLGHRRGVGRQANEPGAVTDDRGLLLPGVLEDVGVPAGGQLGDGTLLPVLEVCGQHVDRQLRATRDFEGSRQERSAHGGQGQAHVARQHAAAVAVALIDSLDPAIVGIGEVAVEAGRPLQGGHDLGIARGDRVDAHRLDVDEVVAHHRAGPLGPVATLALGRDYLVHELGGLLAPLRAVERPAGDVEAHGVVGGDVVRAGQALLGDAFVALDQGRFPLGPPLGGHGLADDLERSDPPRVGPGHVDVAPSAVVLLAEDPFAVGLGLGNELVAAAHDSLEHLRVAGVGVVRPLEAPDHGQRVDDVLVLADPHPRAERPRLGVVALERGADVGDELLAHLVLVGQLRPQPPRRRQHDRRCHHCPEPTCVVHAAPFVKESPDAQHVYRQATRVSWPEQRHRTGFTGPIEERQKAGSCGVADLLSGRG